MTRRSDRVRSSRSGTAAGEGDSPSAVTDKQARALAREVERARVKRSRRKALVIALAVVGSAALVYFTPLLSVRTIAVAGASSVSEEEILDRLDVPVGLPLVRVDTAAAAQRVATIPALATVRVQRKYPSTVQVTVEERTPVAFFESPDGTQLLESSGGDFAIAPPPPGVVRLVTDNPVFGDPVTKDALAVLDTLPPLLRDQAGELRASTLSDISILLLDGRTVVWGSKDDSQRKAAVAIALLSQPGQIFDVSSPDLPTTK